MINHTQSSILVNPAKIPTLIPKQQPLQKNESVRYGSTLSTPANRNATPITKLKIANTFRYFGLTFSVLLILEKGEKTKNVFYD